MASEATHDAQQQPDQAPAQLAPEPATLLLADTDPETQASLSDLLDEEGCRILTADSGQDALATLQREPVDMLLCAARLPDMDGLELLRRAQEGWPDCLRLLICDESAGLEGALPAINETHVYGCLAKPWDQERLRQLLQQSLEQLGAQHERLQRETSLQQQNQNLQALNATQEQRIEACEQELKQTSDMLETAYDELLHFHVMAARMVAHLLHQRLPRHLQTNDQVYALVTAFGEMYGLDTTLQQDLQLAASVYNMGKLTWDDHLLLTPSEQLSGHERTAYQHYPVSGESQLVALDPLKRVAKLVRHHRERWNGNGFPDRLAGTDIPYGSRLLGLAVDFIELQRGMVLPREVPRPQALALLRKFAGRIYDPELCHDFVKLCVEKTPDLHTGGKAVVSLETRQVKPGMILAQDIHSASGMLLLHEGKRLDQHLLAKLMNFEELEGRSFTILVYRP
ncbi:HD domain-containing phosphohydrolase [Billgrantia kenyensis]|uniref:Response regulator n=1 Tax=Billgrantia kenyensis TaxID=321266 RepID=A0A7V9W3U0_9GAMM|nr:HD domain-containing phosphohydrolase [Halomonas kenyensis]MBA2780479.1 response regulator [Halomonas kenyensis]MCG6662393.1 response regulator [Halomonas kenyensis]